MVSYLVFVLVKSKTNFHSPVLSALFTENVYVIDRISNSVPLWYHFVVKTGHIPFQFEVRACCDILSSMALGA